MTMEAPNILFNMGAPLPDDPVVAHVVLHDNMGSDWVLDTGTGKIFRRTLGWNLIEDVDGRKAYDTSGVDYEEIWAHELPKDAQDRLMDVLCHYRDMMRVCSSCQDTGYVQYTHDYWEPCSEECVRRVQVANAKMFAKEAKEQRERFLKSECPYCKELVRNCQCDDIPF